MDALIWEHVQTMFTKRIPSVSRDGWHPITHPQLQGRLWHHTEQRVIVYIALNMKLRIKPYRAMRELCQQLDIRRCVCVLKSNRYCTSRVRALMEPFLFERDSSWHIELFESTFFYMDITTHRLVPPHRAVTHPSEMDQILTDVLGRPDRKALEEFPKLCMQDAVARYYAFSPETLVEIQRPNGEVFYRVCIDATHP